MKPHVFRELVNNLRDIAVQKHDFQSLRELISGRLRKDIQITHEEPPEGSEAFFLTDQQKATLMEVTKDFISSAQGTQFIAPGWMPALVSEVLPKLGIFPTPEQDKLLDVIASQAEALTTLGEQLQSMATRLNQVHSEMDRLMERYCIKEMTTEEVIAWAKAQR